MALIFAGSTELFSGEHTSRFLVPMLRWLRPSLSADSIDRIQFLVRKSTHVAEYAVLGALAQHALWGAPTRTRRASALITLALLVCLVFAALDEFHQSFVPSRESSLRDVVLDGIGAIVGVFLFWWLRRRNLDPASQTESPESLVA